MFQAKKQADEFEGNMGYCGGNLALVNGLVQ